MLPLRGRMQSQRTIVAAADERRYEVRAPPLRGLMSPRRTNSGAARTKAAAARMNAARADERGHVGERTPPQRTNAAAEDERRRDGQTRPRRKRTPTRHTNAAATHERRHRVRRPPRWGRMTPRRAERRRGGRSRRLANVASADECRWGKDDCRRTPYEEAEARA